MHLHLRQFSAIVAAVALGLICAGSAIANPIGPQTPLGSLTDATGAERPAVAAGDGETLVVWRGALDDPVGPDNWHISGRLVDGSSAALGDELEIDTTCCSRPSRPDVTYNAARDEFLVVWRANPAGARLFAQRVGSDGELKGDRVEITSTDGDIAEVARVAWAPGVDEYLVVWDQDLSDRGCCTFFEHVLGLRLRGADATPLPFETPLQLSNGAFGEDYPDVAYDPVSAKWLVAFEGVLDDGENGTRSEQIDAVLVTTVTPQGVVDGPKPVSTPDDAVDRPAVAANTNTGGFAVTWSRQEHDALRISFNGDVVARLVDANGEAVGEEVDVSSKTDLAYGASPAIAFDDNADEYLIAWWQHTFAVPRGLGVVDQVAGRRFDDELVPLTDEQLISVIGDPFTRGSVVNGAMQPVAAYDSSSCSYVSAYEVSSSATNIAARQFAAPACRVAVEQPPPRPPFLSNRDSPIRGAETVTAGGAASLVATRCKSRRVFSIRLVTRRGRRYRSATVSVNGKVVKRLKGGSGEALVDLEGLPAGTFNVRLVAQLADGRTLRYTRRYRTCNRKLRDSNRLDRKDAV